MQNARRAHKIRLCGHLRRYKKIVKKTYIIYIKSFPICRTIDFRQTGLHLSSAVPVDVLV